jgi:predicted PurR-regulated permease PerM
MMLSRLETLSGSMLKWLSSLVGNLGRTLGNLGLTLFIMFFLFQGAGRYRDRVHKYVPMDIRRMDQLFEALRTAIIANIYGMVAVGVAQGLLVGVAFAFTGLRSPFLWGLVAGFASLIPLVGPALVWVPGAAILALSGAWGKALLLIAWGVGVVGLADNIIRPLILQRGVQLSTLAIFLALMGGVNAFGFIGLFAGPVIFTVAYVVWTLLYQERMEWEGRTPVAAGEEPGAPTV